MLSTSKSDDISAKIYFLIKAPYTQTIDFWLDSNDGSDLYVDGVIKVQQLANTCNCSNTFSMAMTAGTYYEFRYFNSLIL